MRNLKPVICPPPDSASECMAEVENRPLSRSPLRASGGRGRSGDVRLHSDGSTLVSRQKRGGRVRFQGLRLHSHDLPRAITTCSKCRRSISPTYFHIPGEGLMCRLW
jgi:hypothetical protein